MSSPALSGMLRHLLTSGSIACTVRTGRRGDELEIGGVVVRIGAEASPKAIAARQAELRTLVPARK